jgi:predicted membrane protein
VRHGARKAWIAAVERELMRASGERNARAVTSNSVRRTLSLILALALAICGIALAWVALRNFGTRPTHARALIAAIFMTTLGMCWLWGCLGKNR